jgi:hypothetical protein
MAEQPKIFEMGDSGYYAVPAIAQEFVEIMPPHGGSPRRLRFRLGAESGPAITLDIPISENCLNSLRSLLSRT